MERYVSIHNLDRSFDIDILAAARPHGDLPGGLGVG